MVEAHTVRRGGQFLISDVNPDEVFIREELSEEQRMFGQTAAEFMQKEVLPVADRLYRHDWELTRHLMQRAAALDLLRLEIPMAGITCSTARRCGSRTASSPTCSRCSRRWTATSSPAFSSSGQWASSAAA